MNGQRLSMISVRLWIAVLTITECENLVCKCCASAFQLEGGTSPAVEVFTAVPRRYVDQLLY